MEKKADRKSRKTEYTRLLIAFIVLLAIIGSFITYLAWPLITGTSIVLATRPVDPFDILRGQYIIINYEINSVPVLEGIEVGEDVYIVLDEDDEGIWRYTDSSLVKPSKGVSIRGEVKSVSGGNMRLEYGIEQYFFERNAQVPTRNLQVEVKIASSGQARISQLLQDGEPIEITYRDLELTS